MTAPSDAMARAAIPANLPELVHTAFTRARASGDVLFFPTQATLINVNSIPFQLRFSPSLASKPVGTKPTAPLPPQSQGEDPKPRAAAAAARFNPFAAPSGPLLITPLGTSHNLVLNKFAVVPEHFILSTQTFKPQHHLLERDDLEAAWGCVEAYHRYRGEGNVDGLGGELFVFYNSGEASGSSQPHRHLQLVPVGRMREGLEGGGEGWEVVAGGLVEGRGKGELPFQTFAERIGEGVDLLGVYKRLYRRACEAVLGEGQVGEEQEGGEARVDYNLAITREVMAIVPRVVEGTPVSVVDGDGTRREVGMLALNGTVLAGTALVKKVEEWDALRAEPGQLVELLGKIGVPNVREDEKTAAML